jgi:hypothetical protein
MMTDLQPPRSPKQTLIRAIVILLLLVIALIGMYSSGHAIWFEK